MMSPRINILITGAGGYLGSSLVEKLVKERDEGNGDFGIVALDVRAISVEERLDGVVYEQADIRDPRLAELIKRNKIDQVVHLAAIVTPPKDATREFMHSVDVLGTKNVLEACVQEGVKRVIVTSSGAAYGYYEDNADWLTEEDPVRGNEEFAYAFHKRLVEEMLATYRRNYPHLEQTIFRVGTVLGKNVSNQITDLFDKKIMFALMGAPSPFVFIWDRDIVNCLMQAVKGDVSGVFNVAGDGAVTLDDIANEQGKWMIKVPPWLVRIGIGLMKNLGVTQYGPEQVRFLQYRPVLDNTRLKEEFGYQPSMTSRQVLQYYLKSRKSINQLKRKNKRRKKTDEIHTTHHFPKTSN